MTRLGFGVSGTLKGTTNDKRRASRRRGCNMNAWIRREIFRTSRVPCPRSFSKWHPPHSYERPHNSE
jgi:hypothetical protein